MIPTLPTLPGAQGARNTQPAYFNNQDTFWKFYQTHPAIRQPQGTGQAQQTNYANVPTLAPANAGTFATAPIPPIQRPPVGPGSTNNPPGTNPPPATGTPTPTGAPATYASANQQALPPGYQAPNLGFPRQKANGSGWATYDDGSYVDYNSRAWKQAQSFMPSDQYSQQVWGQLPDSWKAQIGGWPPEYANAYLSAMVAGFLGKQGTFQGQVMGGFDAAAKIKDLAGQYGKAEAAGQKLQQPTGVGNALAPLWVPSPYLK